MNKIKPATVAASFQPPSRQPIAATRKTAATQGTAWNAVRSGIRTFNRSPSFITESGPWRLTVMKSTIASQNGAVVIV